jgi:ornithine--oxo-acid transaminase
VDEKMIQNSATLGEYFMDQLSEISSPHILEIRGKGLFIGVVLKSSAGGARRFCEALQQHGILAKETHEHVIRFAPPLVIDKETINWALPHIREVLTMT